LEEGGEREGDPGGERGDSGSYIINLLGIIRVAGPAVWERADGEPNWLAGCIRSLLNIKYRTYETEC